MADVKREDTFSLLRSDGQRAVALLLWGRQSRASETLGGCAEKKTADAQLLSSRSRGKRFSTTQTSLVLWASKPLLLQ